MSDDDLADVWARSLADLAGMQIEPHQRAWLQLTRPLGLVESTALIAAPNEFVKEQLETRLRALITNALSRELGRSIQLAVTVDPAATADLGVPAHAGEHGGRPALDDDITGPIPVTLIGGDDLDDFRHPRNGQYGNGISGQPGLDHAGVGLGPFPAQLGPVMGLSGPDPVGPAPGPAPLAGSGAIGRQAPPGGPPLPLSRHGGPQAPGGQLPRPGQARLNPNTRSRHS